MNIETLCWVGIALNVVVLVGYQIQLVRFVLANRLDISRFKLFAVRDRLVSLVAQGLVSEDDPAWKQTYRTVNALLNIKNSQTILGWRLVYIDFLVRQEKDEKTKQRTREIIENAEKLAQRLPEFAHIQDDLAKSFTYMVNQRTYLEHRVSDRLFTAFVKALVWVVSLRAHKNLSSKDSNDIAERTKRPTSPNLVAWGNLQPSV